MVCVLKGNTNSKDSSKLNLYFDTEKNLANCFYNQKLFHFHGKVQQTFIFNITPATFKSKVVVVIATKVKIFPSLFQCIQIQRKRIKIWINNVYEKTTSTSNITKKKNRKKLLKIHQSLQLNWALNLGYISRLNIKGNNNQVTTSNWKGKKRQSDNTTIRQYDKLSKGMHWT